MNIPDINIALLQSDLIWENATQNIAAFEKKINSLPQQTQLVVLPEMFTTGFSMHAKHLAEKMDGMTVTWMKNIAAKRKIVLIGSLIIHNDDSYFNRLIVAYPNQSIAFYDKRHLFSFAGEHLHYKAGDKQLIIQINGWKICVNICYDLRFPVWLRNTSDYDMLIFVANWPEKRNSMWETLLKARAIENQSYVVGVNRVGTDANQHYYCGNSGIYSPLGDLLIYNTNEDCVLNYSLKYQTLQNCRKQFPFLKDRDIFKLF